MLGILRISSIIGPFFLIVLGTQIIDANGLSPPFSRVSIIDEVTGGNIDTGLVDITNYRGNLPIDINSATYFSDGRSLNGTIWLSSPIRDVTDHELYVQSDLQYHMLIALDTFGERWTTYRIVVFPQPDGSWTKNLYELEPGGAQRYKLVEQVKNYTTFEEGNSYIELSASLNLLGYPTSYWVGFESYGRDGRNLNDFVYFEAAPKRENEIEVNIPDIVKLIKGGDMTRIVTLNATGLNQVTNVRLQDYIKDSINITFNPEYVELPIDGSGTTLMTVSVPKTVDNISEQYVRTTNINPSNLNANITEDHLIKLQFIELDPIWSLFNAYPWLTYAIPLAVTSLFALIVYLRLHIDEKTIEQMKKIKMEGLLAANSGVIAGVLIFLSVGATELFFKVGFQQIAVLTASIVIPFSLSAIMIITRQSWSTGIKLMTIGFVYLMTAVIVIAFVGPGVRASN